LVNTWKRSRRSSWSANLASFRPLGRTSLETFECVIRTNLAAVFFTVQTALPHLRDGASIVLNGSVQAVLGIPAGLHTRLRGAASAR